MSVTTLEPKALWKNFADLNAVPRPSKQEERVRKFVREFGEGLGLETIEDEIGNIIIRKPASAGLEDRPTVCLQSHIDMVHQKNASTDFDFSTEGIRMFVDGDWVKAEGTTLGADNGIGVAAMMAILESDSIAHPPLEALFTIDEETGMTGAFELQPGVLEAKYLLNLDTEDDDEITIGCAGGIDVTATGTYKEVDVPADHEGLRLTVRGLNGGHSGMDIDKGYGNANKLLTRILLDVPVQHYGIAEIDGGGLRNAIPREATVLLAANDVDAIKQAVETVSPAIVSEYDTTDPNIEIVIEPADQPAKMMTDEDAKDLLRALQATPNGIWRLSPDVKGLVQTSNNLARVLAKDGKYEVLCLSRSSVESEKMDEVQAIRSVFELIGADVEVSGNYPGWKPLASSGLLDTMRDIFVNRFNEDPNVNACHAGLECGIIGSKYPEMEMVSFGPNIRGAHSPDEKVQISSVQKFWGYLIEVLGKIK